MILGAIGDIFLLKDRDIDEHAWYRVMGRRIHSGCSDIIGGAISPPLVDSKIISLFFCLNVARSIIIIFWAGQYFPTDKNMGIERRNLVEKLKLLSGHFSAESAKDYPPKLKVAPRYQSRDS